MVLKCGECKAMMERGVGWGCQWVRGAGLSPENRVGRASSLGEGNALTVVVLPSPPPREGGPEARGLGASAHQKYRHWRICVRHAHQCVWRARCSRRRGLVRGEGRERRGRCITDPSVV